MNLLMRLRKTLGQSPKQASTDCAEIPVLDIEQGPVYCVGDTHGCLSLYQQLEALIVQDAVSHDGVATIILIGDMVDRGPQSAALLDHLLRPPPGGLRRVCLRGNHEAMMLDYLAMPVANPSWLDFGGIETLASYGIDLAPDELRRLPERKLRQILSAHIPDAHLGFLQQTLPGLQVGRYLLAHAGADAHASLSAQPWQALLWGSGGQVAPDNLTLVRGHYITESPLVQDNVIGIDTGAYATGRLTAVRLSHTQPPAFLTTKDMTAFGPLSRM
jgi:serine/threonine protein phosphatase 1